ncbi:hypothetical protein FDECE_17696 [Fusarium decemcellulare]|nr:hypothetical protein FDECE_17696 [Fusarium decemcellulare]
MAEQQDKNTNASKQSQAPKVPRPLTKKEKIALSEQESALAMILANPGEDIAFELDDDISDEVPEKPLPKEKKAASPKKDVGKNWTESRQFDSYRWQQARSPFGRSRNGFMKGENGAIGIFT